MESRIAMQIILADDDTEDSNFFQEAIIEAQIPAELITAEDGQKLMEVLADIEEVPPPDIIFLDINMPRKNGKTCLREIRNNKRFDKIPVIMFSTSSFPGDIEETYKNGASLYVPKSVFFEDEVKNIKKICSTNWTEYLPKPDKEKYVFRRN